MSANTPMGRPASRSTSRICASRCLVLLVRAVAEVQAEHVDTGVEQRPDHVLVRARRTERGDDLCVTLTSLRSHALVPPVLPVM
jgi:hypothetical protein